MDDNEPTVVVRDNTGVLLMLLLFIFVIMILLTVTLVRLGTLDRKLGALLRPAPRAPRLHGGGSGVEYFYV